MKFSRLTITFAIFILFIIPAYSNENEEELVKIIQANNQINILHINDINGNLKATELVKDDETSGELKGGYARIAYFSKKFREKKPFTLFLSGGDVLGPTPFSSRSKGKVVIDMFNMSGLDVWSPGTYDFLYGYSEINQRIKESKFAVVNTNIFNKKTGKNWIKPYIILEKNNKKIAVLGVTTLDLFSNMPDSIKENFEVKSPFEIIKPLSKELKKEVDLVILIAQMNMGDKAEILNKTDVDFIIGSVGMASESSLTSISIPNGKFAISTQGNCWAVGQVTVQWNKDKSIEYKNVKQNIMDSNLYPDKLLEKYVAPIINKLSEYENKIDNVIGSFNKPINRDEALKFIANVMRYSSQSDITIMNKTFFLRGAFLSNDITKESIYTMIHLPFKSVRLKVSGSALKSYLKNHGIDNNMITAGIDGLNINGNTINDSDSYFVATEESFFKSQIFWKDINSFSYSEKPINDLVYDYILDKKNVPIDVDKLNDYSLWKSSFSVDFDPTLLNITLPDNAPATYLTWKGDQNAARWGGLVSTGLKRFWQSSRFENLLEFELRQQQTGINKIEKYQDRIKIDSIYTTEFLSGLINPFMNLRISSFFINPEISKPHPFLTEFSGGVSHNLPLGFRLKEGLEVRKDLFNPAVPLQVGAVFGIGLNNKVFFINENFESKIYIPSDLSIIVTDIESKSTIPIGSFANLFYKVNLYNESKDFKLWAVRHNIGLNFKFDVPFTF